MKVKELIAILRRFPRKATIKVNNSITFSVNFAATNDNQLTLNITSEESSCGTNSSSSVKKLN